MTMRTFAARAVAAEALGTGLLVATVVGSGIMAETLTTDTAMASQGRTSIRQ
jgi:glycerol uptake facilitator-like aquaporin